ncbi:MAG: hypothetical protein CMJ25_10550 [Phycisphaerae bacterium]|nr:hypothetical protein [Phycisphaerae bacterium]|tara:strand:+ start:897 stop:1175 length:279 start_codon:yes stop_codon:yes gene_type:complete
MSSIIENWVDEPYMNVLFFQCEETRYVIERLDKLDSKNKHIVQSGVIRLLPKNLKKQLLKIYSVEQFKEGINNLCKFYPTYSNATYEIKKLI